MSRIVVVTAVRTESRAVVRTLSEPRRVRHLSRPMWQGEAGTNQVIVVQGGVGREAARSAVLECGGRYDAVVSLGFAGALTADLEPGDLVLPATVVWEEEGSVRRYQVPAGLLGTALDALPDPVRRRTAVGTLFSSPVVLASAMAKRQAAQRHAAVAVEMEAAALASYASDRGLAFLALRAVLDPADLSLERLPSGIESSWKSRARLAVTPGAWGLVRTLSRHAAVASATLAEAAAAVLPAVSMPLIVRA
jgi:nucleoside phosphorylase